MRKKLLFLIFVLVFALGLSACTSKQSQEQVPMDQLAKDGYYHYSNKDLGFSLNLPKEFIYYQTQREESNDYIDIEFFVPTSDTSYRQKVPGYAEAILVRVFVNENWDEILEQAEDGKQYKIAGRKNKKVYTLKFWKKLPSDWQDKWNRKMEEEIQNSFKLN